ncbi:hypothetical protein [Kitasatospora cheerisanensis]|uniref:Acyl-CoA dehydrogenase/oxidase N-terminal domain-containing protein n=1 Tax=Kitasatospora cheerisanensis KCTC 2395 TaxID=1348663 RepID=A0A066Z3Q7_9ACTN|nr:hypothetical protein [Kitasatospora cheerisanensis]KDN86879.1 hypothetical protein KCH_13250 [Kitasatospora cheerisanensis KCTC 2395]
MNRVDTLLPAPADAAPRLPAAASTATGFDEAAVRNIARIARSEHLATDRRRRISARAATAVVRAGFARHFVPRHLGGSAGSFSALLDAATELGRTCLSTAWCATLYAAHGRLASYLPEPGRQQLWADGPDTLIATSIAPQGTAVEEDGGWRLHGRWNTASGVTHARWILLGALVPGPAGPSTASSPSRAPTGRSSTAGTPSACAAPAATASSWRPCTSPGTSPSPSSGWSGRWRTAPPRATASPR